MLLKGEGRVLKSIFNLFKLKTTLSSSILILSKTSSLSYFLNSMTPLSGNTNSENDFRTKFSGATYLLSSDGLIALLLETCRWGEEV